MTTVGRLLIMGKNCAAMNMAIDEAILISLKDIPISTLRFYDWTNPAFSFGYFQNITSDVDVHACHEEKIELVKRMTGGGTVIHGWDLTYSLMLPRSFDEKTISEMYRLIGKNLVNALVKLGISATQYESSTNQNVLSQNLCLTNLAEHDVLYNNKKLAGVSVRRNRNGVLFQGYISLDMPPNPILKRVSKNKEVYQQVIDNSTAINADERRVISKNTLISTISETFDIGISFNTDKMSEKEQILAEDLVKKKYATDKWNFD